MKQNLLLYILLRNIKSDNYPNLITDHSPCENYINTQITYGLKKSTLIYKKISLLKQQSIDLNMKKLICIVIIIACKILPAFSTSTNVFIFGDSDNDTGYFNASNGNCRTIISSNDCAGQLSDSSYPETTGLVSGYHWVDVFANNFGTSITSVDSSATDTTNRATTNGGNNYSASGAQINQTSGQYDGVWSLANQVDRYLLDYNNQADKNALYSFDVTNDLNFTQDLTALNMTNYIDGSTTQTYGYNSAGTSATYTYSSYGDINNLIDDYTAQALKLTNNGARYLLVEMEILAANQDLVNQINYDIYDVSSARSNTLLVSEQGYSETSEYNKSLYDNMRNNNVNIIPYDDESVLLYMVNNYADFGISDYGLKNYACESAERGLTAANCFDSNYHGSEFASFAELERAALTEFIFSDRSHKAPAMLAIEAHVKYNLITAPIQIYMLSESNIQSQKSLLSSINKHIKKHNLSAANKKNKVNQNQDYAPLKQKKLQLWLDNNINYQEYNLNKTGFSDIDSNEYSFSAGLDYKMSSNLMTGIALNTSLKDNNYSYDRGEFMQKKISTSIYNQVKKNNFILNTIANVALTDHEIERIAKMGITNQKVKADTTSYQMSAMLELSYQFLNKNNTIENLPYVKFTYINDKLKSFTESSDANILALKYNDLKLESKEIEIGYNFRTHFNLYQPYFEISYVKELGELENAVEAAITSSTAYDDYYTIYAKEKNDSYIKLKIGNNFKLSKKISLDANFETYYGDGENIYKNYMLNLNYLF
jgi:uncharacterized protein YhjY with autotransporter beta-barrel domain